MSDSQGLDLDAVSAFLDAASVPQDADLTVSLVGGGKSNLTYRVSDGTHRWILRRPPVGDVVRGAHDVGREFRVMGALHTTPVPVPNVTAMCTDTGYIGVPFYLMDEVDGEVLRTRALVEELSVEDRTAVGLALVDTLADLHDVDFTLVGLATLGRPDGYLERQLDRWLRQYRAIAARELPQIEPIAHTLRETMPTSSATSIVHGDFRIDNVIVDRDSPGTIRAVLDWEMATLGDPLADLATLIMFWDEPGRPFNPITGGLTAFEGFPSVNEVIKRYSARRGIQPGGLDWYLCFSQFKLAVILEQIHTRHTSGETIGDGFEGIDIMVDQLLAEASEAALTLSKPSPISHEESA